MLEIQRDVQTESRIFASSKSMYRAYVETVMRQSEWGASYEPGRQGPHAEKLMFCANAVYGAYAHTHGATDDDGGGAWVAEIIVPAPPGLLVIARRTDRSFFWEGSVLARMAGRVVRFKDSMGVEEVMSGRRGGAAGE